MDVIYSSYSPHFITSATQIALNIINHFNNLFLQVDSLPDASFDCVLVTAGFEATVWYFILLTF